MLPISTLINKLFVWLFLTFSGTHAAVSSVLQMNWFLFLVNYLRFPKSLSKLLHKYFTNSDRKFLLRVVSTACCVLDLLLENWALSTILICHTQDSGRGMGHIHWHWFMIVLNIAKIFFLCLLKEERQKILCWQGIVKYLALKIFFLVVVCLTTLVGWCYKAI